ncbi:hypothetical protein VMCG_01420 [Cytospora schulzeri]|uniref:Mid2 domain-containing protein n=1 Tax=Cytospora schulzeri TaxID=448051 RepID=A0A423X5K1_9PEZI|nr:hypothetical protein VMCG_01420 [Valsa malicola]
MLAPGYLWATFATLVVRISCSNDFVTSKFPSEFKQNKTAEFYWDNLDGYIAGIRVYSAAGDSDSSSDWILGFLKLTLSTEPNCPDSDSDSSCTAYANNGSAYFDGTLANGDQVPLGSGYELRLLWTDSKSYDDIDDDTSEVTSPTFSIVPGESGDEGSKGSPGMSKAEKAGIAIAVILVVMFMVLLLLWKLTKERRHRRRRNKRRKAEKDEENGDGEDRRWSSVAARGLGMKKGMRESWTAAAANLPVKPSPMAVGSRGIGNKRGGRLYLDYKAELPSDPSNPHQIDTQGLTAAAGTNTEREVPTISIAPVELPAEPLGGPGATRQSRIATTTFVYDPRPPYALRSPASQHAELSPVSPLSPNSDGVAAIGALDGSVSPLTPISRKPVGAGGARGAPAEMR